MPRSKSPEQLKYICQSNNWKCTKCGTRHPRKLDKCFVCGSTDTIKLDKITNKDKRKSKTRGTTINIKA